MFPEELSVLESINRPVLGKLQETPLPFYPRGIGHFRRAAGHDENIPEGIKNFVQFFWFADGTGETRLTPGGKIYPLQPGNFFYRLPRETHYFRPTSSFWEYYWITFDGPQAREFIAAYGYPPSPFAAGKCPVESFTEVWELMREQTPWAWRKMIAVIGDILAAAGGNDAEETAENRLLRQAIHLFQENFSDPAINVNILAERLQINRTTLRRLFRRKIATTPIAYLSKLRLQKAISLLRQTHWPLRRIARMSGFEQVNYFCNVFKQQTGQTPSELRRSLA